MDHLKLCVEEDRRTGGCDCRTICKFRAPPPDVRYYRVTDWGRSRLNVSTDEDAITHVKSFYDGNKFPKLKRVVKETREVIFEDSE